jgi:hypothetical protein
MCEVNNDPYRYLRAHSQEQLIEIIIDLERRLLDREVEDSRGRRQWPADLFCPGCDLPHLHWDGRKTRCLLCDR